MGGAKGEGGASKVRRLLLLVYGVGERRSLAAVTVQPDLVLGTLGKCIVDVEIVGASILVEQRHIIADYHCYSRRYISPLHCYCVTSLLPHF